MAKWLFRKNYAPDWAWRKNTRKNRKEARRYMLHTSDPLMQGDIRNDLDAVDKRKRRSL